MSKTLTWGQATALAGACFVSTVCLEQLLLWVVPPTTATWPWVATFTNFVGFLLPAALFANAADAPFWWRSEGPPGTARPSAQVVGAVFLALPFVLLQHALALGLAHLGVPRLSVETGGAWPQATAWVLGQQWMALAFAPALCEEVVFRGLIQPAYTARFGPVAGLVGTAALFCACHVEPQDALALFPLALALGALARRTRGLWPAIALHLTYNTWMLLLALWGSFYEHYSWLVPWSVVGFVLGLAMLAPGGLRRFLGR